MHLLHDVQCKRDHPVYDQGAGVAQKERLSLTGAVLHPLQDGTLDNVTFQGRAGGSQTPVMPHSIAKSLVGSEYDSTPASTVIGHALTDLHAAHEDLDGLSPASMLGHAPVSTGDGSIGELTA